MKLKPISEQKILITGATSGIGLTTAGMAAEKGAAVGLIARNEEALAQLRDELTAKGYKAACCAADVSDERAFRAAADVVIAELGGVDTWVNNAGGSIYGRIMDVPTEDLRHLFETNVWGVVNGSKLAVENLRIDGGALINLGSEVSDSPIPLQGMYSASKHAVKGFTDALRMELEADDLPISVTLIKPTAIHTPFPQNARNYLPYEPALPDPMYAPELAAEAILHCAENQVRDFFVGDMAKINSTIAHFAPGIGATIQESLIDTFQNSGEAPRADRKDGLYSTNSKLQQRGADTDRFVMEFSPYQKASLHPYVTAGLLVGGGVALAAMISKSFRSGNGSTEELTY